SRMTAPNERRSTMRINCPSVTVSADDSLTRLSSRSVKFCSGVLVFARVIVPEWIADVRASVVGPRLSLIRPELHRPRVHLVVQLKKPFAFQLRNGSRVGPVPVLTAEAILFQGCTRGGRIVCIVGAVDVAPKTGVDRAFCVAVPKTEFCSAGAGALGRTRTSRHLRRAAGGQHEERSACHRQSCR